jgi:lipoate-protein ligase A
MDLVRAGFPASPAFDIAVSHALLREVADGARAETTRLYRPGPTMAFGRLDALAPGYDAACAQARAHGFEPVLRLGGGHAAGYDQRALVVEHLTRQDTVAGGLQDRFAEATALLVEALRDVGLDAGVGELPGEYCAGTWSLHARGVKVAGVAQRAIRGAALVTSVVVVGGGPQLRAALVDVYEALGIPWDPGTAGAAQDVLPSMDVDALDAALTSALARRFTLVERRLDASTLALAREREAEHRAPVAAS